jgi:hypothetical protein
MILGMITVPSVEPAEVWVLTDTKVNPNDERTEFTGGTGDPDFYPEPRYLGKYRLFTVTDGSITVRDKHVDHGYLYFDPTFIANFDQPPAQMTPGDTITLNATTEGSGYVSPHSGGWNSGITFQYYGDGVTLLGDPIAGTNLDFISDTSTVNFDVPAVTAGGRLEISAFLWNCPAGLVQYIYEPGTAKEEEFVITNTSVCGANAAPEQERLITEDTEGTCGEVTLNDVPVPQNSSRQIREFDRILMAKKSRATISHDCFDGLVAFLYLQYFSGKKNPDSTAPVILLAILVLHHDPSICLPEYSNLYAESSSNRISLDLQSGGGRFKPALDNLALDIETDTAKVSSVAKNDFAVSHNPDTDVTSAACYAGSVTVDPTNPALPSVTLKTGKQVEVTRDSIGPITNIGQTISAPILLLLDDGAM